jgi:hypothetical protein
MEMSQENLLCSYLYLKQQKNNHFPFFSSTKLENRRSEQLLKGGGVWYQWEGEGGGKRVGG